MNAEEKIILSLLTYQVYRSKLSIDKYLAILEYISIIREANFIHINLR